MTNIQQTRPGDFLFYFDAPNEIGRLIQLGETWEERSNGPWPYHVAVALNSTDKIEADGKEVEINPIDYGKFVVCRVPFSPPKLARALMWSRTRVGRLYGYIGIVDQILRDISGGRLYLPKWFITWANNRWPFCSSIGAQIGIRAGINRYLRMKGLPDFNTYPPPSPADLWRIMKAFVV